MIQTDRDGTPIGFAAADALQALAARKGTVVRAVLDELNVAFSPHRGVYQLPRWAADRVRAELEGRADV